MGATYRAPHSDHRFPPVEIDHDSTLDTFVALAGSTLRYDRADGCWRLLVGDFWAREMVPVALASEAMASGDLSALFRLIFRAETDPRLALDTV